MSEITRKAAALVESGGITEVQSRTFLAPSSSHPEIVHVVSACHTPNGWAWFCPCEAGRHLRRCYHVDAAKLLLAKEAHHGV